MATRSLHCTVLEALAEEAPTVQGPLLAAYGTRAAHAALLVTLLPPYADTLVQTAARLEALEELMTQRFGEEVGGPARARARKTHGQALEEVKRQRATVMDAVAKHGL